jgi:hypothetical protein
MCAIHRPLTRGINSPCHSRQDPPLWILSARITIILVPCGLNHVEGFACLSKGFLRAKLVLSVDIAIATGVDVKVVLTHFRSWLWRRLEGGVEV